MFHGLENPDFGMLAGAWHADGEQHVYLPACLQYQHPEDRNQAWVPKIIVLLSMWLAITSVLMFPLDVANTRACSTGVSPSACTLTLPMYTLWQAVFISGLVLAFAIIPFTMFYYEADSD